MSPLVPRRAVLAWPAALSILAWSRRGRAEGVTVPPSLQASLTAKLGAFDRNLPARSAGVARVLVVTRPGEPSSQRVAREFQAALRGVPTIAGLPSELAELSYEGTAPLVSRIREGRASMVYFAAGFVSDAASLGGALRGQDVLSICAEPAAVARGIAVGFDLVSGQPKILVNLAQARAQNVALTGALLSLALIVGGA